MKRRVFLGMLGTGALAAACVRWWPDDGLWHPCLPPALPPDLAAHPLLRALWEDVDPAACWDAHAHLLGVGDGGSGAWINPALRSVLHPIQTAQFRFYLNAACVADDGGADAAFLARLRALCEGLPAGVKLMLLAFDYRYDERGARVAEESPLYVPNRYAAAVAAAFPERFEWIASIHPYRDDCVEAVDAAARQGARAMKWLPPVMGMDPASSLCDRFYAALARHDLPLLSHGGVEHAVSGAGADDYGNPLRLCRALAHGVRVIVGHCASMGKGVDLDRGADGPRLDNFALFARMMDEADYHGRLFGDIAAITQVNRAGPPLRSLLRREDWHARLLNGSDYPLPGVMPLFSLRGLVRDGFIDAAEAKVLVALRRHHPWLFDWALKRRVAAGGRRFAPGVFETRRVFDKTYQAPSR